MSRPLLTGRLRRGHLVALDVTLALLLVGIAAGNLAAGAWESGMLPRWVDWIVTFGLGVPLVLRRFRPIRAFGAAVLLSIVCALDGGSLVTYFAIAMPLHAVAGTEPRRRSVPALALALLFTLAINVAQPKPSTLGEIALGWTMLGAAWAIGRTTLERHQYAALTAQQQAHQAVLDERLRIARELHDVVAHSLSLVTVRAGVVHHLTKEPETREALAVIEDTAREALTEMRQVLGVLRSTSDGAELAPTPGLAGLPELTERAKSAGVPVELEIRGPESAPEGVELTVYRIVQEALTNVVKHTVRARCRVTVEEVGGEIRVEVVDDGPAASDSIGEAGHGLIGMRERVAVYGGRFEAGPRSEGGFAVSAVLPGE